MLGMYSNKHHAGIGVRMGMYVYVRACVRARTRVCVCLCVRVRGRKMKKGIAQGSLELLFSQRHSQCGCLQKIFTFKVPF
jgi:hypothetical protein